MLSVNVPCPCPLSMCMIHTGPWMDSCNNLSVWNTRNKSLYLHADKLSAIRRYTELFPPSFNLQCRPQLIADVLLSAAFLSLVPFTLHRYSTVSVLAGGVILFLLPHSKIFYCCLDWQRPTKLLKQTISTASCWDFEWLMMSNQDCAVVSASAWESTSKQ